MSLAATTTVRALVLLATAWLSVGAALAVQPDEVLADKRQEARARAISAEIRCLVCQNQSIDDSDAPLARDLRILVRDRIRTGDDDAAIRAFIVDRYGTFVLLRPPVNPHTLLLWFGPPAILALAGLGVLAMRRRRPDPLPAPLTQEEEEAIAALVGDPPSGRGPGRPSGAA